MGVISYLLGRNKNANKRVVYLSINKIDIKQKEKLETTLKGMTIQNTAAIMIGINTKLPNGSHSLVYSDQMGEMLQKKVKDLGDVPLITYAEDSCLGVGFHMLSHGSVVLSNPNSFLGNVGFSADPWNLKEFAEHWRFKMQYIHKGKNKVRLNRFEEFKQEDIDWLLKIMNKRVDSIVNDITTKRSNKIGVKQQDVAKILRDGELIKPKQAVELGLVDELITPDEYILREFGKDIYIDAVQLNWKQKMGFQTQVDLAAEADIIGPENMEQMDQHYNMKKPGKTQELSTTIEIESWRQRLNVENRVSKTKDHQDLDQLKEQLAEKNTYMHYFKNEDVKTQEKFTENTTTQFAYDQAKGEEDNDYCKKCKYESKWCKHRQTREVAKQKLGAALTTTQQYGWREPYDSLTFGYNKSGMCKRTFFDHGHLQ
eukprot:403375856